MREDLWRVRHARGIRFLSLATGLSESELNDVIDTGVVSEGTRKTLEKWCSERLERVNHLLTDEERASYVST